MLKVGMGPLGLRVGLWEDVCQLARRCAGTLDPRP